LCPFKYTIPMHTAFLSSAFCVMDEIWTGHILNTTQKHYSLKELAQLAIYS
jgi:hypothetical protein